MAKSPDLDRYAFSEAAPWNVEPTELTWTRGVDTVRWVTRHQVPELTKARRIPPIGRLTTVVRHLGGAVAGWYLLDRRKGGETSRRGISRRVRRAAETLGPTYIKLGQIISSGQGLFPDELVAEARKCRDQVPAEPFEVVRQTVESGLGRAIEDVFESFDREPLAAASIAQVHRATLRPAAPGEEVVEVVVKVQRSTVGELVLDDLRVMSWLAPFLVGRIPVAALANPPALVELFAETITEELDFRLEAQNMLDVAASFKLLGQEGYVIPRPHPELVSQRVLVMERLNGFQFEDVAGITEAGIDTEAIIRTGMIGFMEGCMIHGIFHGDLHGGNLFVMEDGRTALLDFGITARMTPKEQGAFLRLLVGASMNDLNTQLEAMRDLGALPEDADLAAVIRDLGLDRGPIDPTQMQPEELIAELQGMVKQMMAYGARLPKILMLFVKNLVFLDAAIGTLAPQLDLFGEVTHIATYFATTHGEQIAAQVGVDVANYEMDLEGIKAGFGVDPGQVHSLTWEELQDRRRTIRNRLGVHW